MVFKVLVHAGPDGATDAVRVELSNEADVFFLYSAVVDASTFRAMRDEQHLMVEFSELVSVLTQSVVRTQCVWATEGLGE